MGEIAGGRAGVWGSPLVSPSQTVLGPVKYSALALTKGSKGKKKEQTYT